MLKKSILAVLTLLVLAACGNKDEKLSAEEQQRIIEEGTIGFEMAGGQIQKVENIPAEEEAAILAAFDEYIAALNAEEIERYMQTVSKNPKGFNFEEEEKYVSEKFEQFDNKREAKNITIIQYDEAEAQVYANITMHTLELATGTELESAGQQVTVFVKEDGDWKLTRVAYIGDDSKSNTIN